MRRKNYRKKNRPLLCILLVLACVVFSVTFLSGPGEEPAAVEPSESTAPIEAPPAPTPTPLPAPGTLLESGTDINRNYYKRLDYTGTASDLSASSFVLGKERPATNGKTGQDHQGLLTVNFGQDTLVKKALLYYSDDRYEIYMGSAADLKIAPGETFDVVLKDPAATELWAEEIIVAGFVF